MVPRCHKCFDELVPVMVYVETAEGVERVVAVLRCRRCGATSREVIRTDPPARHLRRV